MKWISNGFWCTKPRIGHLIAGGHDKDASRQVFDFKGFGTTIRRLFHRLFQCKLLIQNDLEQRNNLEQPFSRARTCEKNNHTITGVKKIPIGENHKKGCSRLFSCSKYRYIKGLSVEQRGTTYGTTSMMLILLKRDTHFAKDSRAGPERAPRSCAALSRRGLPGSGIARTLSAARAAPDRAVFRGCWAITPRGREVLRVECDPQHITPSKPEKSEPTP